MDLSANERYIPRCPPAAPLSRTTRIVRRLPRVDRGARSSAAKTRPPTAQQTGKDLPELQTMRPYPRTFRAASVTMRSAYSSAECRKFSTTRLFPAMRTDARIEPLCGYMNQRSRPQCDRVSQGKEALFAVMRDP